MYSGFNALQNNIIYSHNILTDKSECVFLPHEEPQNSGDFYQIQCTIDGSNKAAFFRITGNNVKIFNLTFINGKSFSVSSAGVWGEFTPEQQASLGKFEKVIDFSVFGDFYPFCHILRGQHHK